MKCLNLQLYQVLICQIAMFYLLYMFVLESQNQLKTYSSSEKEVTTPTSPSYRRATACLGVLCILLISALIAVSIISKDISKVWFHPFRWTWFIKNLLNVYCIRSYNIYCGNGGIHGDRTEYFHKMLLCKIGFLSKIVYDELTVWCCKDYFSLQTTIIWHITKKFW